MLLDPQVGTVSVGSDDPESVLGVGSSAAVPSVPSHQRAGPDGEEAARPVWPLAGLAQLGVSSIKQPTSRRLADVERGWGRVDEVTKTGCRSRHTAMSSITMTANTLGSCLSAFFDDHHDLALKRLASTVIAR